MGYTHYWRQAKELDKDTFRTAAGDCRTVCEALRIAIFDAGGVDRPVFGEDFIELNGSTEDGYETFVVDCAFEPHHTDTPDEHGRYFDFCKTEHRPYDIAVQCCLIVLRHYFGDQFTVSSDGTPDEWAPAREACQESLGYGQDFQLSPM